MNITKVSVLVAIATTLLCGNAQADETYSIVLAGGRVIDPETRFDAIRNVGITGEKIVKISQQPLSGAEVIDVSGLIVAPGFIDLHSHAFTPLSQEYQVQDGVTTALELESGSYPIDAFSQPLEGRTVQNIGATAGYGSVRREVFGWPAFLTQTATETERVDLRRILEDGLDKGGLGVGLAVDYYSEAVNEEEIRAIFEIAADRGATIFVHMRRGVNGDPTGLYEVLGLARETGASLHICHITHNAMVNIELFLQEIQQAREDSVDVTAELLPYTAGSVGIGAAVFGRDWRTIFNIEPQDVEWLETGERFKNIEQFEEARQTNPNGLIVHHYLREEWNRRALSEPGMIVVSDMVRMVSSDRKVAPHNGAFSRVLGRYVREQGAITLQDALSRMTILPAKRMEGASGAFKSKGRLREGMDADITVFDWDRVIDRATYQDPFQPSEGIEHVFVNGVPVVRHSAFIEGVFPGRMIYGDL